MRPRRIIVVSCSRAKFPRDGLMPALARYNGPMFKMLRKQLPKYPDVLLLIVSAKYGVIDAHTPIRDYDVRAWGSFDYIPQNIWVANVCRHYDLPQTEGVFLPVGLFVAQKWYLDLAQDRIGCRALAPAGSPLRTQLVAGPQGKRVAAAKRWLEAGAE